MAADSDSMFEQPDFSLIGGTSADETDYDDEEFEDGEDDGEDGEDGEDGDDDTAGEDNTAGEADDDEEDSGEAVEPDDDSDSVANRLHGGAAKAVLEHITRMLVDDPDSVTVEVSEGRGGLRFAVHVAQGDMGRLIGRRGRTAQAIRTLVRAAAASDGVSATVDIVD